MPRPIQPGGPRVMVGGGGEQRTLKIAAAHADMTHWFPLGLETLLHKAEVLRGHCEAIGRDPATIERTMATPVIVVGSEAEASAALERIPPERRPFVDVGTPEQMAEPLRPVPRCRLHRVHLQQLDLPDAGGDRTGRRAAPTDRRRKARSLRSRGPGAVQVRLKDVVEYRVTPAAWVFADTFTVPFGVALVIGRVITALPLTSV